MKKRLRKKHRRGEFRQLGFELGFSTPAQWDEAAALAFWDDFILNAVEANGLAYGGGCGRRWDGFVIGLRERASVAPEQRAALEAWLRARSDITELAVGRLIDAWNDEGEIAARAT